MARPFRSSSLFVLVLLATGCPDERPDNEVADGGDTASDTNAESDGDTSTPQDTDADTSTPQDTDGDLEVEPDGDVGPALAVAHRGARMMGAPIQLSVTDTAAGRFLWVGTRANFDPADGRLRGGLMRADLASGEVLRVEDALPREDYAEFMLVDPQTFGPAPTAGVHADGDRFVVVSRTGLLGLSGDDSQEVTEVPIVHQGGPLVPIQFALARSAARPVAWMTSSEGLARLDEDTWTVEALIRGVDLGIANDSGGDFGRLAVDPESGAVFASYFLRDGRSALVRVGVDNQRKVWLSGEGGPGGRVGELVFSTRRGGVYAALASWSAGDGGVVFWDGDAVTSVVREGPLAQAHSGEVGAFGASSLALDEVHDVLAVGGQVQSGLSGLRGGGLVLLDVAGLADVAGGAGEGGTPRTIGVKDRQSPLIHWHVQGLVWDPVGRELFVAVSDLCNESRLRARGVYGVRWVEADGFVFRRPFTSTIRSLAVVDGRDGEGTLVAGLRDDNGGLACESMPVQAGLGRLEVGGVGLWPVVSVAGDLISVDPGVTALFSDEDGLSLGTWRDGFLSGVAGAQRVEGFVGNPALIGPSLFLEAVVHRRVASGRELWLAGRTSHQNGDPAVLADRGPRGMARLILDDSGLVSATRFVRVSEDLADVVGLPSGDVRDLVMTTGGDLIAACAKERLSPNYDRDEMPVFEVDGQARGGGVARVLAGESSVEVLADSSVTPDPRAVAIDASGRLVVADVERGILRTKSPLGEAAPVFEAVATPGYIDGARPIRVWAGHGEDLAVASSKGLWVRLSGRVVVVDDVGFVWALQWKDGVLWAGSDEGLVGVAPVGVPMVLPVQAAGRALPFR